MIIDAFLFFNELDILEIRLNELKGIVDRYVLIEGNRTFRGKEKTCCFDENRLRFDGWPITSYVVDVPADAETPWEREYASRRASKMALETLGLPDDATVLLSDVDEIPRADAIPEIRGCASSGWTVALEQDHFYYYLDLLDKDERWYGTRACSWKRFREQDPKELHFVSHPSGSEVVIRNAGWHFGYMGGNQAIREKVAAFCHAELDRPEIMNDGYLDHCKRKGKVLCNEHKLVHVSIDRMPRYVIENRERFKDLLLHG